MLDCESHKTDFSFVDNLFEILLLSDCIFHKLIAKI